MGVNWQSNDYYRALKDYEKDSGLSVADQNRINNPYGNHSFGGLLISQILPQLIVGGAEKIGIGLSGSGDTGSETNVEESTNSAKGINYIKSKLDKAIESKNQTDIDKYLKEFERMANENPKRYKSAYEAAKAKVNNGGQRTSQI